MDLLQGLYVRTPILGYVDPRFCPLYRVCYYFDHRLVVVDWVSLVAGAEVENPAVSSLEGASASKHFPSFEPGDEDDSVGRGDIKSLAVHLRVG